MADFSTERSIIVSGCSLFTSLQLNSQRRYHCHFVLASTIQCTKRMAKESLGSNYTASQATASAFNRTSESTLCTGPSTCRNKLAAMCPNACCSHAYISMCIFRLHSTPCMHVWAQRPAPTKERAIDAYTSVHGYARRVLFLQARWQLALATRGRRVHLGNGRMQQSCNYRGTLFSD